MQFEQFFRKYKISKNDIHDIIFLVVAIKISSIPL